jgi:hypothetical protein
MTSHKTTYLETSIRKGFTSEDVRMWSALCKNCETEIGESTAFMWTILDIAKHNSVGPLDVVKMGRQLCKQKSINKDFIKAILASVCSDGEEDEEIVGKVLDLTAEEEDLSGSYEETDDFYKDMPNSNEAYEIDGFVVPDHHSEPENDDDEDDKPKKLRKRKVQLMSSEVHLEAN